MTLSITAGDLRGQDQEVNLLAGEVDLARLVDLAVKKLAVNVQYNPADLNGAKVRLRLRDGLTDDELWSLTNELLASHGFAIVQTETTNLLSIVRVQDASRTALVQPVVGDSRAGYISVLVELQHLPTAKVVLMIRPLLSKPGGMLTQLGETNLLLISDYRTRVDQLLDFIDRVDVPATDAVIETIRVSFLPADELQTLMQEASGAMGDISGTPLRGKLIPSPDNDALVLIAPQDELSRWRELVQRFDQRQAVFTRSYAPRHFGVEDVAQLLTDTIPGRTLHGSDNRWRVVADDLTGTLIVTATTAEHQEIESMIDRLDRVPSATRLPVRIFPIRNRDVYEILDVLTTLVEAGALESNSVQSRRHDFNDSSQQRTVREVLPPGGDSVMYPPQRNQDRSTTTNENYSDDRTTPGETPFTLTADEGTNSLIAMADARRLDQLEQLIQTLDIRQPQVMIEAIMITLTDADTFDLGVELEKLDAGGGTMTTLSSLFGLGAAGATGLATGSGFTASVLNPGDFRILIRALETINNGRTLTIPKVLVNNHQDAVLNSVLQQPVASINASNTVATTAFGGTQDAGTTITVRPQITEGDYLRLQYSVSLSSFVGDSADPSLPPPRQQNNLQSIVSIPDGYTVVVGGLEINTETEAKAQVPVLGRIPFIGAAFRNKSVNRSRNRFYVFIRANILRHGGFEDLKYLSDRDNRTAGIDDDWPDVEPRVIR